MSTETRVTRNMVDAFSAFAAGSGGEVKHFPGARCFRSPIQLIEFNCAFVLDKAGVRPETLEMVKSFFGGQRSEWMFTAPPSVADDFYVIPRHISVTRFRRDPEMILPKESATLRPLPSGLEVHRVRDVNELLSWARTSSVGFEMSDPGFLDRLATSQTLGTEGLTCYLGICSGQRVTTCILYESDNVAGIYHVSTVPEFRGRGFGAAVSAFAVREGFQRGCDLSSLQATPMGFPVYLKMGFRYVLDYLNWIVSPRT